MHIQKHIRRLLAALLLLCLHTSQGRAQEQGFQLLPDSSNFVKASVIVATPGNDFYSLMGHVAIRMECPQHELDFCFSFLTFDDTESILRFFAGNAEGHIVAIPTGIYLESFRKEGRGVEQRTLNLTLHEQQLLWRLLDNDMVNARDRKFNFAKNNCTSIALLMLRASLIEGDEPNFHWLPIMETADNGTLLQDITRHTPWMRFLCMTLFGTEGERTWDNHYRASPDMLIPLLEASTIANGKEERPFLTGEREQLSATQVTPQPLWWSPTRLFGALLALVLLLTAAEWGLGWRRAAGVADCLLLTTQTLAGVLLAFITFQAGLFGVHWNWFLVPVNPLPALLWLACRKRAWWGGIYGLYSLVLAGFALGGFLLSVYMVPHMLVAATMTTRCLSKYFAFKKSKNITKSQQTT